MKTMTDIPKEVLEEARDWVQRAHSDLRDKSVVAIMALALLSRDKRAAEIAQDLGDYIVADAILTYDTPTGQEDGT